MKQIQPTKHIRITLQPVVWAYLKRWTGVLNNMVENKGKGTRIREDQVIAAIITIATIDGCEQFDKLHAQQLSDRLESLGVLRLVRTEASEATIGYDALSTDAGGRPAAEGSVPGRAGVGPRRALPRHDLAPGQVLRRRSRDGRRPSRREPPTAA